MGTVQGAGNANVLQQSDVISPSGVSNVNATPICAVQLSQCVNQGVIQESDRPCSGDNNFSQLNHMQSQHRHLGATCYSTGAFTLPQAHNTLGNVTTVSHNMADHNVVHVPRLDTTLGTQSTAGNNQSITSAKSSYVNTHNSVNTDSNNVVYFTAPQTATNQGAMARGDRCQAVVGSNKHIQVAQQNCSEGTGQQIPDHIIPSMQTLRQSADINRQVQQRYRELDEASRLSHQGNLDLLIEALTKKQKNEKIKVKWPQDLAFVGTMKKRPTYDQLTTCQWMLGYLRIRQEETDVKIREHMIEYLTELMQDACDYSWESAKGAHSVLLHRMADGVVDWGQVKEVQKIRKRYAQMTATPSQEKYSKSQKAVPCLRHNKGTCLRTSDHEWQNLMLKHMCQFCHTQFNKVEHHARKDCWKAPKEN